MWKILQGNSVDVLKEIESESVDCIVTSPPYYGLRDYGTGTWIGGDPECPHRRMSHWSDKTTTGHKQEELRGMISSGIYKTVCPLCGAVRVDQQIGLEESPDEYISRLVEVFRECKRVLKNDGTLWVNIGDSYWGSGSRGYDFTDKQSEKSAIQKGSKGTTDLSGVPKLVGKHGDIKNKDIIGIPWLLAFALRKDGWYLRQDIIWHKPNPMPESVTDRFTKSHEYIFFFTKQAHYYFDQESIKENANPKYEGRYKSVFNKGKVQETPLPNGAEWNTEGMREYTGKRNKRDVWSIPVKPIKEVHFATFPEELITPCILAGSRKGGTVLDPFCGSGTTGIVAINNERDFIGIELNKDYIEISERRIRHEEEQGFQMTMEI